MKKNKASIRRGVHTRIRKKVSGTSQRPRLAVFRSVNHIYAQIIDDVNGKTLASASTVEKDLGLKSGGNIEAAQKIGKTVAERALSAGVSQVVFDRGGFVYHGRVKALIDATRDAGLNQNQGDASAVNSPADEGIIDTVATAVGNVVGAISDAIGDLVGGSVANENSAKKSGADKAKKTDDAQAETDKVKEKNENE